MKPGRLFLEICEPYEAGVFDVVIFEVGVFVFCPKLSAWHHL